MMGFVNFINKGGNMDTEQNNNQLYKFIINNEVFQENLTHSEAENLYYDLVDSGYIRIEKQQTEAV